MLIYLHRGTAIEYSRYHKYISGRGHKATIANFSNPGDVAICVVRDPVCRFVSIYNYWRYGSDMFERESYWVPPVDSIHDFIMAASSKTHPKHAEIIKTMKMGRGFTWAAHFQPQKQWLRGGTKKNVVLIRHTSDRIVYGDRVIAAFALLGVGRENVTEVNVSNRLMNDTNTKEQLSPEAIDWIKQYYKADVKLWDTANKQFDTGKGPWKAVF
jgi:hypothetical protein